ncbi:hypothetical protein DOT66_12625 [Ralstonia pseudosolanacearum]|uniref:hypothetical protein n=1 Tax=Ralstonia pseudosolanacearum TaxID=1310165 RepID=UPI0008DAFCA8|nr:hypothetical protein [Ralstonia pseudosolanacearum]AZU58774.1 hypothetical protein CFM90_21495 [Ralstonia solanacearum]MCK4138528.1 hypothetical protein [Ralstonia pseudosolanacearum]OHU97942.1 hypothetical protein BLA34_21810 [Ralstonia solanacearum]QVX40644.1 hypothetical protein J4H89_22865 [Ralstonia solanacearum]RAA09255.1 hypothetical protein DOT66_12625 [Ralstonia pseudosolanacearum]
MSAPQSAWDALRFQLKAINDDGAECSLSRIAEVSIDPSESIVHIERAHCFGATITTLRLSGSGTVSTVVTDAGCIRELSLEYGAAKIDREGRVVVRSWRESDDRVGAPPSFT